MLYTTNWDFKWNLNLNLNCDLNHRRDVFYNLYFKKSEGFGKFDWDNQIMLISFSTSLKSFHFCNMFSSWYVIFDQLFIFKFIPLYSYTFYVLLSLFICIHSVLHSHNTVPSFHARYLCIPICIQRCVCYWMDGHQPERESILFARKLFLWKE